MLSLLAGSRKDKPAPKLRPTVDVLRAGPDLYMVRGVEGGDYFRITLRERYLLRLLDGRNTSEDIRRNYVERFGDELGLRPLSEFIGQLDSHGLLAHSELPSITPPSPAPPVPQPLGQGDKGAWFNKLFDVLVVLFGWTLSPLWAPVYLALTCIGVVTLARHFDRYLMEMSGLFTLIPTWILIPLSLAQTILFMNLPRELAIGMAVRQFKGRVHKFGLFMLGGMLPFFACDPGDSIQRMSARGRFTVLTSGMVTHVLIGAAATIAWDMAPTGSGLAIFCELLILPWVVGTFLHLNPFVRLDGYKLMTTLLKEPRLQERALEETNAWLSFRQSPEALGARERFWLRFYGLGWHTWMWCLRLIYLVGGTWWLTTRLEGLGALIAVSIIIVWYRKQLTRWL
jgi:hypothetical protein